MIVTIGGIKGGVGKSLIAVNLTVIRALAGKRVLFIDGDEQGTSGDWTDHRIGLGISTPWTSIRLKGSAVRTEARKMANDYDDIIIDCGGRDTDSLRAALTISDVLVVPFQPKSFDIWTASSVAVMVDEARSINANLKAYAFINCGGPRGSDNRDAQEIIKQTEGLDLLPIVIGLRKAFSNATAEGLGVVETGSDCKAIAEISSLHDAIFGTKKTKPRRKCDVKLTK
jgi:chromosome partitioning protein